MKKTIAVILVFCVFMGGFATAAQAQSSRFIIGNPYETVDWNTWGQFKAQLHVHTDASDGALPLSEVVEIHYALGYDILAITDHMVTGVPWDTIPRTAPLMRLRMRERTGKRPIAPLSSERREEMLAGVGRYDAQGNPRPMLEVTQGNELNGAVFRQNHVQGFFTDYGQGRLGVTLDFLRPIRGVHRTGGLSVINHPGDVHRATRDSDPMTFFDRYPDWVEKFAYPLVRYHESAIGIDVNSGWGNHTRYDRILYDRILERTIPHGVVPWLFTFSDGHSPGDFDRAFTVHLMPELSVSALRTSMEDGTFFGFSRNARQELDDDDWRGEGNPPQINRITVDENAGTIYIDAENYNRIHWVSHRSEVIRRGHTIDVSQHMDDDQFFVRAYLLGDGGILYTQPFTVQRPRQQPLEQERMVNPFDYSVPLRWLANTGDFIVRWFFPLRWVWNAITWFDPQVDFPHLMRWIGYVA